MSSVTALPAPPFPGAGRAKNRQYGRSKWCKSPFLRLFIYYQSPYRYQVLKLGARWHERTLTLIELAIIMQIPLLGVSVLPAFGSKIASTATTGDVNQFLFTCCFPLIFRCMYRSQSQSMGTFRPEITGLLWCHFRYQHRHFQVLEGHKPPSW